MDIGNKMLKDNLEVIKETSKKDNKPAENKQGCVKMNDYFAF